MSIIGTVSTSNEYDCIRLISADALEIVIRIQFVNQSKILPFMVHLQPTTPTIEPEITLDPTNWDETRLLGHRMVDNMLDYLRDVRLRPVCRPMSSEVKAAFTENNHLPLEGESPWQVYEELSTNILPYNVGNIHSCSWGYVEGAGSAIGALAELVVGTMNTSSWGGHQASTYVELQVLSWLKEIMGFDKTNSSGVLVSGTSMAMMVALAAARRKFQGQMMKVYCSTEAHNCLARAVDVMGVGKENLVFVPTNEQRQIDLNALKAVLDPNSCGFVIGTAGNVGTGAIDNIQSLADLCSSRGNLWLHIDGAIGAVARISPRPRPLFSGIERADSLVFDLHKWLFVPYECGCILVRDGELHRSTFAQSVRASYLTMMDGGIMPSHGEPLFSDYCFELSRSMKALKVWMTLKIYGLNRLGAIMEQNVNQIQYFTSLLAQNSNELQLLATDQLISFAFDIGVTISMMIR